MDAFLNDLRDLGEPALRLIAAVIVGALLGINRDLYGKPAGFRLCALVSLGAGLITVITSDPHVGLADPNGASRAIQGIVGGIGFLGAGVILHEGRDNRVRNLTTAATIWISAALGIACGLGSWKMGGVAAVLALLVLSFGLRIDHALFGRFGGDDDKPDKPE
ncbi:putative Mg2+ transporter-C (MgtC) family protein [Rhizobiales bacterium GAS191]|nr:putative Mg2+ transporter-C (MgtC) family protein [Rhizobiales bacterium GAS113]SEE06586.1 putative Mg2+ transporter-C (MgtC) family protein [Rhizobiales bacterium GAS191]SEE47142.1 putative Mg2+ transporter-C (MgtC) family protein [Rhizobiales bacterium GAS188]